jgi:hypothetical protein
MRRLAPAIYPKTCMALSLIACRARMRRRA